jgi:hypothetical protein
MTYSGNSDPRHDTPLASGWQGAIGAKNAADAAAIVRAYSTFAPVIHYDPNLAIAQGTHETGWWLSPAWTGRRNPAGLGITGDSVQGPGFGTIERGVQAHLALLNCYYGDGTDPWGVLTQFHMGGMTLGKTNLNGMNGVWAVPGTGYGDAIAAIANQITGGSVVTDTGVYGEDIVAALIPHLGESNSDGTLDPWNGPHPWPGYCEASTEGAQYAAGLTDVVHRGSAALKLDAVTAQGLLQTSWPPEDGGICLWGRAFDPQGHTTVWSAAKGMWISTLYPPHAGLDYFYSDAWKAAMAGWYRAPGVVAANRAVPPVVPITPQTPFFVDQNPYGPVPMRDLFWARWDALNAMGTKLDHPGAINPKGQALPIIGYPMEAERTLLTGRRIQKFERGYLATNNGSDPFDVVMLMLSEQPG